MSQIPATNGQKMSPRPPQEGFKHQWGMTGAAQPNHGGTRNPSNTILTNTLIPRDYLGSLSRSRTPTFESKPSEQPLKLSQPTKPPPETRNGLSEAVKQPNPMSVEEQVKYIKHPDIQREYNGERKFQAQTSATARTTSPPSETEQRSMAILPPAAMSEPSEVVSRKNYSSIQTSTNPRLMSIDNTIASQTALRKDSVDSNTSEADVQALIARSGTTQDLIRQLLKEKTQASSQNAQLWTLVEKQRALLLGLSKDLERMTKDRDRYKRKLKEFQEAHMLSASASTNSQLANEGQATPLPKHPDPTYSPTKSSPKASSDALSRPLTPQRNPSLPTHSSPIDPAMLPMPLHVGQILSQSLHDPNSVSHKNTPSASSSNYDLGTGAPSPISEHGERMSPVKTNPTYPKQPIIALTEPSPILGQVQRSMSASRKSPPKPLNLNQSRVPPSYFEKGSPVDRTPKSENGEPVDRRERSLRPGSHRRRPTQDEEGDRERVITPHSAPASRSKQLEEDKPAEVRNGAGSLRLHKHSSPRVLLPPTDSNQSVDTESHEQSLFAPLRSPGLPSSPRPFPANALPTSPRDTTFAHQQTPRAPKQPILLPSPQGLPNVSTTPQDTATAQTIQDTPIKSDRAGRVDSPTSVTSVPSIYQGFVNSAYPGLLLPPNALPLVQVKIISARLHPPQMSPGSQRYAEEHFVFVLSVFSRSKDQELWRLEKPPNSLAVLDGHLRSQCSGLPPLPDRKLFNGHSPIVVDARRSAVDTYFERLLDTPMDENTAIYICKYLSTDIIDPALLPLGESGPYHRTQGSVDSNTEGKPKKAGYLTKKGKNFGGWKSRYFVLDSPELRYFEAPGGAHLGTIKLTNAQIGRQLPSDTHPEDDSDPESQFRHSFLILEPKRKDSTNFLRHVLCAESDAERDDWVDVLLFYVEGLPSSSSTTTITTTKTRNAPNPSDAAVKKTTPPLAQVATHESSPTSIGSTTEATIIDQTTPSKLTTTISGPINGTVITDAAAWGNRAAPNKDRDSRKRNLFHLKKSSHERLPSISVSDDRPRTSENSNRSQANAYLRPVFGMPLSDAVAHCAPVNVDVYLPAVVYRCIEYLRVKKAANEEGIFRLSGSSVVVRNLKERFNTEGDVDLAGDGQYYDIHAVASLFKTYLRELPSTILTRELHLEFLQVLDVQENAEKVKKFHALVHKMPTVNYTLLRSLSEYLLEVVQNADRNKMNVKNVGIVFAPTLNIPSPVFSMFLTNFDEIFDDQITISGGRVAGVTRMQAGQDV